MSLQLNLEKGKEALKLSLQKKGIHTPPSADLAFILDVSGSFHGEHIGGTTQKLLERLVPYGMLFDPDQKLDVFTFSTDPEYVGEITPKTTDGYIKSEIVHKVSNYNGGTCYAGVIEMALKHFGWLGGKPGFFGKLMGAKEATKRRSIVLFVTDGDNSDHRDTMRILEESEKRGDQVYFLFIGIGHADFPFLKRAADKFGNTGLTIIKNINDFTAQTDEQMNDVLIGDELVEWLKK